MYIMYLYIKLILNLEFYIVRLIGGTGTDENFDYQRQENRI